VVTTRVEAGSDQWQRNGSRRATHLPQQRGTAVLCAAQPLSSRRRQLFSARRFTRRFASVDDQISLDVAAWRPATDRGREPSGGAR